MAKLGHCPHCGNIVSITALACPRCGAQFYRPSKGGIGTGCGCLLILVLIVVGSSMYFARMERREGGGNEGEARSAPADVASPKKVPTGPRPEPTGKAAELLKRAEDLQEKRLPYAAEAEFRRVVKEYPGTAEAKEAAERVKAIEAARE